MFQNLYFFCSVASTRPLSCVPGWIKDFMLSLLPRPSSSWFIPKTVTEIIFFKISSSTKIYHGTTFSYKFFLISQLYTYCLLEEEGTRRNVFLTLSLSFHVTFPWAKNTLYPFIPSIEQYFIHWTNLIYFLCK